jgi:hypothetical protein
MQTINYRNMQDAVTPLEILNLYYSSGNVAGIRKDKLWHQINSLLSWENIINNDYQRELCPLLFYIITKKLPEIQSRRTDNRMPGKTVPQFILGKLKEEYLHNLKRNMILLSELQGLMKEFMKNDIKFITLKGAYLAETVYENFACRPMADIDILVRGNDIERSHQVLINRGFRIFQEESVRSLHDNYLKEDQREKISVELHHRLTNALYCARFDMAEIWGQTYLPLEYNFVYLSWHAVRHSFLKLIWLCDCAAIIKKHNYSLNWEEIVRKSVLFNARKQLQLCLHLISKLLIPDIAHNTHLSFDHSLCSRISETILFNVQNTIAHQKDPDVFTKLLTIHTMERKTLFKFALEYMKQ